MILFPIEELADTAQVGAGDVRCCRTDPDPATWRALPSADGRRRRRGDVVTSQSSGAREWSQKEKEDGMNRGQSLVRYGLTASSFRDLLLTSTLRKTKHSTSRKYGLGVPARTPPPARSHAPRPNRTPIATGRRDQMVAQKKNMAVIIRFYSLISIENDHAPTPAAEYPS
ncbi:hypothetical protein EVAR_19860_1 [Eumeta japonica]|uniref:Uncharacterized protein n=1 Tax=Eumeta variegata TaxID=151549 RepID=A0A4C1UQU7_EUMVA|nr:hypothetical protein EVAR_19860_1 [Eumeta japonica]